jgi:hypothetical protein
VNGKWFDLDPEVEIPELVSSAYKVDGQDNQPARPGASGNVSEEGSTDLRR